MFITCQNDRIVGQERISYFLYLIFDYKLHKMHLKLELLRHFRMEKYHFIIVDIVI